MGNIFDRYQRADTAPNIVIFDEAQRADTANIVIFDEDQRVDTDIIVIVNEDQRADTDNIVIFDEAQRADTANIVIFDEDQRADTDIIVIVNEDQRADTDIIVIVNEDQRADTDNIVMEDGYSVLHYLPLYKAALTNDWKAAGAIFDKDQRADTAKITYMSETVLHIAVGTNSSHSFVDNLVDRLWDKANLSKKDCFGNTSLHCAAKVGNTKAAIALVKKYPEMIMIENQSGNTAVNLAAMHAQKETLVYLLNVNKWPLIKVCRGRASPYIGVAGGNLITYVITAGFYDVALDLIMEYPNLVTQKDKNELTALQILATNPRDFSSSGRWWFWWQYLVYFFTFKNTKLVPVPKQTDKLMKEMIKAVLKDGNDNNAWDALGPAMLTAAKHGIHEFVEECLRRCPGLIWYEEDDKYLFMVAIINRQVKVYNLIYQMTGYALLIVTNTIGANTALHIVGKKPPMHRLQTITGAALQMQRELQWFEEVEKAMTPHYKKALNQDNKSPGMVFTEEHADLVEKGEKWMKDTALSSTLVAALIITVTFAAIFTVPGGNNDKDGTPKFLRDTTFMVFAISDIVALFAAVTSVLMFLAIHTSRFAEHDFIRKLPTKLSIGLLSLFISIAAVMVAFCAATDLVLRGKIRWILILSGAMGSLPVISFILLQFPLLWELLLSTYGPNIFHKQNKLKLH